MSSIFNSTVWSWIKMVLPTRFCDTVELPGQGLSTPQEQGHLWGVLSLWACCRSRLMSLTTEVWQWKTSSSPLLPEKNKPPPFLCSFPSHQRFPLTAHLERLCPSAMSCEEKGESSSWGREWGVQTPLLLLLLQGEHSWACRKGQAELGAQQGKQRARKDCRAWDWHCRCNGNTAPTFQRFLSAAPAVPFVYLDLSCISCSSLINQHYLLLPWNTERLFCVHSLQEGRSGKVQASCVQTVQPAVCVVHTQ